LARRTLGEEAAADGALAEEQVADLHDIRVVSSKYSSK
jgi:hypothetical protein